MQETPDNEPNWERKVLVRLATEALAEQRRRRRWSIFFKLLGFAYLTAVLALVIDWTAFGIPDEHQYTALVGLDGVISEKSEANAELAVAALQSAFEDKTTKGVILRINSPGGSPVQAGIINAEILRLRKKYPDIPLYAVVEDVCASGGYYVAVAADKIYVDKASIIGSIGVLMDSFGFTGLMEKIGVERRLLTAGENKGFLDPFSPQQARHREHAQVLLQDIHHQFIDAVRKGRGARLKETPEMFSGLFWTGHKSIEMGLADDYGTVDSVAREVIQAEKIRDFTQHHSLAERFARRFGSDAAEAFLNRLAGTTVR